MRMRKPWLNYHKPGASVREFHEPLKKPRELFWARFWLITGVHIAAHRFYLWKNKSAGLWLVGFYLGAIILLLISAAVFPQDDGRIVSIAGPLLWIMVIAIEYRRLPKMVSQANKLNFEDMTEDDYRLRGEIGPFAAMRDVARFGVFSFFMYFILMNLLGENNLLVGGALLLFMLCLFVGYRQYTAIEKQGREGL